MSRASRIVGKILRYVAIGVAALLLIAAGVFLYLTTDAGERRIANFVESSVDDSIAGSIEIENLEFHGDSVELYGLKVLSTTGETVLAVEQVEVDIALRSVLSDQITVEELVIREYTVWIRRQDGEIGLQAALEPTEPPREVQRSVRIDKLQLVDGTIVTDLGEREALAFQVSNLDISGSLVTGENLRFDLAGTGQVEDMAPGKLAIAVRLEPTEGRTQELAFDASLDSNSLHGLVALPAAPGEDLRVSDIEGSLTANMSRFEHQGFTYGPVNLDAHLAGERLEVEEALVELPGLRLHREPAEGDTIAIAIELGSLAQTSQALSQLLGTQAPPVAGSGDMAVRISNPITSPQLAFEGTMRELRWGQTGAQPVTVQRLMLEGQIEDSRLRNGHVRAELDGLRSGERSIASAQLEASLETRKLTLDARVGAPYRAELHVQGEQITEEELRIDTLTMTYPRASWQLTQPAYLNVGGSLEDLVLASGEQRIAIDAGWKPAPRIDARLSDFRLATLPRAALEGMPEVRGVLNADVQLEMQGDSISGDVNATLANWGIAPASGERATLEARLANERVTGTFSMQAYGGSVDATFDAPMSPAISDKAIDAEIRAQRLQLAAMWRDVYGEIEAPSASKIASISGQIGGLVRLSGTVEQPVPSGRLRLSNGAIALSDGNEYQNIRLLIAGTERRVRIREAVVHAGDGQASLSGTATRIRSGRYRFDLRFDANDFPLPGEEPKLATVAGAIKGRASLDQVEAELTFRDVVVEGQPAEEVEREIAVAATETPRPRASVR